MTTQTQAQYREWVAFIHAIVAELEAAGRTFGVVRIDDLVPAFRDGVPAADFAAAAIARTDAQLAELARDLEDPSWRLQQTTQRLDDDAAAGFTRD